MIVEDNEGKWEAKCDLCQWKTNQLKQSDAENKLRNHINTVHKKGIKEIKKQKRPISKQDLPPKIPTPIKEN